MRQAREFKKNETDAYVILLILTDGAIHDMEETKNSLIEAAYLPMSIIIIGVGDADFSLMDELDGDDGLWNAHGDKCARDLVQFVPYNDFKHSPERLAAEVLEELPTQLVEYKEIIKRPPNQCQNRVEMSEILPSHPTGSILHSNEYNEGVQVMDVNQMFAKRPLNVQR